MTVRILFLISVVSLTISIISGTYWLYLHKQNRGRGDISFWMYCYRCGVKWRPTPYGPPAPDDYYCVVCNKTDCVQWIRDRYGRIKEFQSKEGVTNGYPSNGRRTNTEGGNS